MISAGAYVFTADGRLVVPEQHGAGLQCRVDEDVIIDVLDLPELALFAVRSQHGGVLALQPAR